MLKYFFLILLAFSFTVHAQEHAKHSPKRPSHDRPRAHDPKSTPHSVPGHSPRKPKSDAPEKSTKPRVPKDPPVRPTDKIHGRKPYPDMLWYKLMLLDKLSSRSDKPGPPTYDRILNYDSLSEIEGILSAADAKPTLENILATYDPTLSLTEMEQNLDEAFEGTSYLPYWQDGPDFQVNRAWLIHVAHALWVEKHAGLPWSLRNLSPDQIQFLLPTRWLVDMPAVPEGMELHQWLHVAPQHYGDHYEARPPSFIQLETYKLYPLALRLEGNTSQESISHFIDWVVQNIMHTYADETGEWTELELYPEMMAALDERLRNSMVDELLPMRLEELFTARVGGCGVPSGLVVALARSLNLPAQLLHLDRHRIAWFPTIDSVVHGDILAQHHLRAQYSLIQTQIMTSFGDEDSNLEVNPRGYDISSYGEVAMRSNFGMKRDWTTLNPGKSWSGEEAIAPPNYNVVVWPLEPINPVNKPTWSGEKTIGLNYNDIYNDMRVRPEVTETLVFLEAFHPQLIQERINPNVRDIPRNLRFYIVADSLPIQTLEQLRGE